MVYKLCYYKTTVGPYQKKVIENQLLYETDLQQINNKHFFTFLKPIQALLKP